MAKDYIDIGPTPPEESCIQVGDPNYHELAKPECIRYIAAIRAKLGDEPDGARLRIKSNNHDFGTYYDVICEFDDENAEAIDYALACEAIGPMTWDDTTRVDWKLELAAYRERQEKRRLESYR